MDNASGSEPSTRSPRTVPTLGSGQQAFVAGFLFDRRDRVALVRKLRPSWQAGKLNGVGGKIEPGETPQQAMRREFREEAQLDVRHWGHFLTLTFDSGEVWFFHARTTSPVLDSVRAGTDEAIEVHPLTELLAKGASIIPNLRWILPLAAYTHDTYLPITVSEAPAF